MISLAREIEWTSVTTGMPDGAEIRLVGEWDFKRRTCFYWSEDQSRQIWVRR